MILQAILTFFYSTLGTYITLLDIPDLPRSVTRVLDTMMDYINSGIQIAANYLPLDLMVQLFGIILAVDIGIRLYHFVMWIIKKIPLSIE